MTPWIWSAWTLFLIFVIQVGSDHLVPLDVIDTPGSGRVMEMENSEENFEVVPYHELFTALLKKLEMFRKSDPFQSTEEVSLLPRSDRNTFNPNLSSNLKPTTLPHVRTNLCDKDILKRVYASTLGVWRG